MAELANSQIFRDDPCRTPEERLWKAVLSQGVYEACTKRSQATPLSYGEMRSAAEWIDLANRDFCTVCIYAGYDPRYIVRKTKGRINKWVPSGA
tara:strand:+ start:303 stop:584 length:282 start_codon:yes stop_codon:yes gene_type:complete